VTDANLIIGKVFIVLHFDIN